VIESRQLDPVTAEQALRLILDSGLDAWVFTDDDWLVRNGNAPYVDMETRTLQFEPKLVSSFADAYLSRAIKIVGVSQDQALMAACETMMQRLFGERVTARRSQPYYLDVTDKGANKGAVLDKISDLLRIPAPRIATIGDMPNDVLMFRKSGLSIAMGNSGDEVKAQAMATTGSNDSDGFAEAMKRLVLPADQAPSLLRRKV
jgi:hydroxymethylpyrimidine pyrophosphatase-like HAD family hydrolase